MTKENEKRKSHAIQLFTEGMNPAQIAETIGGVTTSTVYRWLKQPDFQLSLSKQLRIMGRISFMKAITEIEPSLVAIASIRDDLSNHSSVRLKAAESLLGVAFRAVESASQEELDQLEVLINAKRIGTVDA